MSPASSHTRPYGHLAQGRVRQRSGRVMGDHRSCCAAMTSTSRPRSRSLRTVRRVCRNVKRWRNAAMALRWTAAGMMEAAKGFRRLKAYKHLPVLRAALAAHQSKYVTQRVEHDANVA